MAKSKFAALVSVRNATHGNASREKLKKAIEKARECGASSSEIEKELNIGLKMGLENRLR
jgi:hypothetical protein